MLTRPASGVIATPWFPLGSPPCWHGLAYDDLQAQFVPYPHTEKPSSESVA